MAAAVFHVVAYAAPAAPSRVALRSSKRSAFASGPSSLRLAAVLPRQQGRNTRQAAVLPRAETLWTLRVDKKEKRSALSDFEPLNLTEMMDARRKGPNNTCTLTVGAAPEDEGVDVFLPVETVSGKHAELEEDGDTGDLFVTDLGSTNGTYINGKRAEGKTKIHPGDLICFGGLPVFVCHRNAMAHA